MRILAILVTLAMFIPRVAEGATVGSFGCESGYGQIAIFGEITKETARQFQEEVERCERKAERVAIVVCPNSGGGDLEAALKIGRMVREHESAVRIYESAVCLSSCVYILAGGVVRIVEGKVGIHAPSDPIEKDSSYATSKSKFDTLKKVVRTYLDEMNLSQLLYDDMLLTPSYDIKILSPKKLVKYGLSGDDPVWREAKEVGQAKRLGISRIELGRRKRLVEKVCSPKSQRGDMDGYVECSDRIMFRP